MAPRADQFVKLSGFEHAVDAGLFHLFRENPEIARSGKNAGKQKADWRVRYAQSHATFLMSAKTKTGSLTIVSASNYATIPPVELCKAVGVRGHDGQILGSAASLNAVEEDTYCFALSRWMRLMIGNWIAEKCGSWGLTAGQLGVSLWRATDGRHSVSRHHDEQAKELESEAIHGGRASVWFYGVVGDRKTCPPPPGNPPPDPPYKRIRGQLHKVDVRSMYPWLLGARLYPTKLQGLHNDFTPSKLAEYLKSWGCIAQVELEAREGEYPYRVPRGVRFPVGRFWTTLAEPELLAALARREVKRVGLVARYVKGTPFVKWSRFVLDKRLSCRVSGDGAGEVLWKLVANSFSGKFAQKSRHWVYDGQARPMISWGEYTAPEPESEAVARYRVLQGIPFRLIEGGRGARLPAAVHCYLTSYGRMHMRGIRTLLGPGCVVAQHTDGLWLTDQGLERARALGLLSGDGPGTLRLEESVSYARFFDASHYYVGDNWTLAGVASGWRLTGTAEVEVRSVREPVLDERDPSQGQLLEYIRRQRLDGIIPNVPVGKDGWARPHLADGSAVGPKAKNEDRGEGESAVPAKRQRREPPPLPWE